MKILFVLCGMFLLINCKDNDGSLAWKNPKTIEESVLVISDDSATIEQKMLKEKLERLVYENVDVVDNQLILKIDAGYWKEHDISPAYETIVKQSLEETNRGIKEFMKNGWFEDGFDVKSSFLRSKEEYFKNINCD